MMKLSLLFATLALAAADDSVNDDQEQRFLRPGNPLQGSAGCGTNRDDVPDDDMWLRFNKVSFPPGETPAEAMPLLPEDFPLCPETARWLRKSYCWSVISEQDTKEINDLSLKSLIDEIGGLPTHATSNISSPFWDEFREVIDMRKARLENHDPALYFPQIPSVWAGLTLADIGEAVHNEYPGKNQALLLEKFIMGGAQMDRKVIPSVNRVDFLRHEVAIGMLNTWAISTIGPYNFGVKWYGGRARPEEVAWYIQNKTKAELTGVVPEDVIDAIHAMNLTHPHEFTQYPEGCPTHPAWPAMHSAASVMSFWSAVVMNLTKAQICEAQSLDWGVSYGRTVAGVHYPSDNTDGLNLGQLILVKKLPQFLKQHYGAKLKDVRDKIQSLRHDWRNYPTGDCFPSTSSG